MLTPRLSGLLSFALLLNMSAFIFVPLCCGDGQL